MNWPRFLNDTNYDYCEIQGVCGSLEKYFSKFITSFSFYLVDKLILYIGYI